MLAKAVLAAMRQARQAGGRHHLAGQPPAVYDPTELRCTDGADMGNSCLSDTQIATVKTVMSPIATNDSTWSHPGYNFGAENSAKGWGDCLAIGVVPGRRFRAGRLSDGFVRSFVTRDPAFDSEHLGSQPVAGASLSLIGSMYQAFNPDLGALKAHGAKMIMMNGSDRHVREPARYRCATTIRSSSKMGQAETDQFLELFLAAGVGALFRWRRPRSGRSS